MPKPLVFLLIGLLFGTGAGFLAGAGVGPSHQRAKEADASSVHDHSAHDHGGGKHALVEAANPLPTLAITLHPDSPQSRNLEISVTNFTFDPKAVNGANIPGRGHAHVYVNGIKFARAYGAWLHLDALPKGTHQIRVTLNSNDHGHLAVEGSPIEALTTLIID